MFANYKAYEFINKKVDQARLNEDRSIILK